MAAPLVALTLMCLTAGGTRPAPTGSPGPKREVKAREPMLSCEGAAIFEQDGHWYRLVRGAYVECSPELPPSV